METPLVSPYDGVVDARPRCRGRPRRGRRRPRRAGSLMDAADFTRIRWRSSTTARGGGRSGSIPETMKIATADAGDSALGGDRPPESAGGGRHAPSRRRAPPEQGEDDPLVFPAEAPGPVAPVSAVRRGSGGVLPCAAAREPARRSCIAPDDRHPDRETLDHAFAEAESTYGDDPPLPLWWGGYLLGAVCAELADSRTATPLPATIAAAMPGA